MKTNRRSKSTRRSTVAEKAMGAVSRRVRELHRLHGLPLVVWRNGKVSREPVRANGV